MVIKGTLFMDFKAQETVEVKEGEIIIIPKGTEHRPRTNGDVVLNLLFEPKETKHTGVVNSAKTVHSLEWI
jgi:mannose-6-phosphate isomerase-like protein (cupin superfamily)